LANFGPDLAKKALDLTLNIGTWQCHTFREEIFNRHSVIATDLAREYVRIAEEHDYRAANLTLLNLDSILQRADLNLTEDDHTLKQFAEKRASECRMVKETSPDPAQALAFCNKISQPYGFSNLQKFQSPDEPTPLLNRYCDEKWWLKQVRTLNTQTLDQIARSLSKVHKHATPYCDKKTHWSRQSQKTRNRKYLESTYATNQNGQSFSLQELSDLSVSNPSIRRAELMTRISGFEMVADHLGHVGEFYTLTTPSKYHPMLANGKRNPRYQQATPKQAQKYLTHLWRLVRAELHRRKIQVYGFRVVEPHHDGTPHWHLLLFMEQSHRTQVREIMQHYALLEDGNEPGAQKYRFKAIEIDKEKGSAAGYIAKYVTKNIDGSHIEKDLDGNDASKAALSIEAWASTWNIRQFQQIGGPSVTVWRELRKLDHANNPEVESLRKHADAGDWAAYVLAMGGPTLPRKQHPVKPAYEIMTDEGETIDRETGEIQPKRETRYGDTPQPRLQGLDCKGLFEKTRKHTWDISQTKPETMPDEQLINQHRERSADAAQSERFSARCKAAEFRPLDSCQ
jgi:hypothetical protein